MGVLMSSISEVDDVRIDESRSYPVKFILAEISDGKDKKTILKSDNSEYHNEIAHKLEVELAGRSEVKVTDGAWLLFDRENKKITIWGSSSTYNKDRFPDYNKAKELLLKKYEGFKIVIDRNYRRLKN